ncbi:MAG: peptidoglycan DD-metalloendopeptidase family protein [Cyanobacteria bacterium P01_E01_bin.42]
MKHRKSTLDRGDRLYHLLVKRLTRKRRRKKRDRRVRKTKTSSDWSLSMGLLTLTMLFCILRTPVIEPLIDTVQENLSSVPDVLNFLGWERWKSDEFFRSLDRVSLLAISSDRSIMMNPQNFKRSCFSELLSRHQRERDNILNGLSEYQIKKACIYVARIRAFLDVISWAETGSIGEASYTVIVFKGGNRIKNFSTHPFVGGGWKANQNCAFIRRAGKRVCSSASGRYQIMDFNYRSLTKNEIIRDFTPASQDKAAIYYLQQKGVLKDIAFGNFEKAACKVGGHWASFPCNNYRQPQKKIQQLRYVFDRQVVKYTIGFEETFQELKRNYISADLRSQSSRMVSKPVPDRATILSQGFQEFHQGIDLAASLGTPIRAVADGKIVYSGWDEWGLGNVVKIRHRDRGETVYAHNRRLFVKAGDRVSRGQIVAEMGSTGNSTGSHLHFEYRRPNGGKMASGEPEMQAFNPCNRLFACPAIGDRF